MCIDELAHTAESLTQIQVMRKEIHFQLLRSSRAHNAHARTHSLALAKSVFHLTQEEDSTHTASGYVN